MEWIEDKKEWIGLVKLVVIEIVIGIENIVLIEIMEEKMKKKKRNSERMVGIGLEIVMSMVMIE